MIDKTEAYSTTKDMAERRPCSTTDALRRDVTNIDIPDEEEVVLSSTRRAHQKYFARVTLDRFEDLQVLGLIPRRLKQQAVRAAIKTDDEQALRVTEERLRGNRVTAAPCHCHEAPATVPSFSEDLRATYRQVRGDYNPAPAQLLSDHFGTAAAVKIWALER